MKLNLRGHEDRYAIEQSLLAFFPEERPVYEGEDGDSHAEVTLHEGNVYATGVTTLTYGGKTARGEARVRTAGVSDAYERERLRQRALKLSFFRAARDVTGVTPSWGALTGIRPAKLVRTMLEDGMTPAQADRVLRDTYCVSPARRRLALESAEAGLKARSDLRPEDISLYIGIPFCPTRCAYCSFVSASVEKSFKLMEPYLAALTAEVEAAGRMVKEAGLRIKSFYMGGGTPTTLSASQMDALLTAVNRNFDLSDCVEYCIEAGRPDTIDREKLQVLLDHGADRISVNPQSLEPRVLSAIGRKHSPEDIEKAMELATSMGFPHVNMDLIAGLPADTPEGFRRSLDACVALGAASFIMQASESIISVCFNSSLLKYGGDVAVGAMTILTSVMQFAMLPLQGLGQGAQPIMSYNYGAKNSDRVKKAYFLLLKTLFGFLSVFLTPLCHQEVKYFLLT